MTTTAGHSSPVPSAAPTERDDFDPCGAPCLGVGRAAGRDSRPALPGVATGATFVNVQRVQPARIIPPLAWGTADGRTIAFRVDETAGRELQAALAAGESPTAIVEPEQVVAADIDLVR